MERNRSAKEEGAITGKKPWVLREVSRALGGSAVRCDSGDGSGEYDRGNDLIKQVIYVVENAVRKCVSKYVAVCWFFVIRGIENY